MHIQITQSDRNYFDSVTNNGTTMGIFTHIVSIVCPDEKKLIIPISHRHTIVKMWDIDKELKNKFRLYEPPNCGDCVSIANLIKDYYICSVNDGNHMNLLVHCDAGISRSSAITLGILWNISGLYFNDACYKTPNHMDTLKDDYMELRKIACSSMLNENSTPLKRFIDGRFNPGVKPNQAILEHYRKYFDNFPW